MSILQKSYESEIRTNIRDLIISRLGVTNTQVAIDADLREDLGADSLDVAELVAALGKVSKISLPSGEGRYARTLDGIRTVNHLLGLLSDTLLVAGG